MAIQNPADKTDIGIVWLRRDLRLADQPALHAARHAHAQIVLVYIHAPHEEAWGLGAASASWLHHSLVAFEQDVQRAGGALVLRQGDSSAVLRQVVAETGATGVYWNRVYEPTLVQRDEVIKRTLRSDGLTVESYNANLYNEPWTVRTGGETPYRVFTPYWRKASADLANADPLPLPRKLHCATLPSDALATLNLLPAQQWDVGFYPDHQPGEAGAHLALEVFLDDAVARYAGDRDLPYRRGTSRLSPHLHFGEISPRQIHRALLQCELGDAKQHDAYIRELGWREFATQLLFYFPHTVEQPLQANFAAFPWAEVDALALRAWQSGRTGIPIVDAGMRELWQTGWMHNRVRMVVASFLTKNLRYHWIHGARWFFDTLVDADLANNTQGWQWSAGCGADAAPYFRVFNPVTQGERFDPQGEYVRRFVPELRHLDHKTIHKPWAIGGVRGYPKPIIDLKESREAALAAYQRYRSSVES